MSEDAETDIQQLWTLSTQIKTDFSQCSAARDLMPWTTPSTKAQVYVGIVSSDSSIAYYKIEGKSLALDSF